ncbi:MAG: M16 family metallopeptidase [Acidobacteriota bacterium]
MSRYLLLLVAFGWLVAPPAPLEAQTRRGTIGTQRRVPPPEHFKHFESRKDDGNITRVVLRNGLTVVVEEVHSAPLASVVTYVKAGYFDEPDDVMGIAHVIEHMYFKGTTSRGVGEIARQTRALGGVLNAATAYDRTYYHATVPSENIEKAIEIQADAFLNPAFDSGELKKEIEVIIQESRRKQDSPLPFALETLYDSAFEQHRMGRWRMGRDEGLRALTRDRLVDFYQRYYTPRNTIMVVSGSIHREKVLQKITEAFARLKRPDGDRSHSPAEPEQTEPRYRFVRGDLARGYVLMGYHIPGEEHPDFYPLQVLASLLGNGRASLLSRHVREKKLAQVAGSELAAYRGAGMLTLFLAVDPAAVDSAETAALAQIEAVRRTRPAPYDLERAIALLERSFYDEAQQIDGRATQLAHFEALGGYRKRAEFLPKIRSVKAEEVRQAAQRYLGMNDLTLLEYFPKTAQVRSFTGPGFRTSAGALVAAELQRQQLERPEVDPFLRSLKLPESARPFTANHLRYPLKKSAVLRGPDFYFREDHSLPLVSIGLFYAGGRALETSENAGVTELLLQSSLKGSTQMTAPLLAAQLEVFGGTLRVVNEPDYFGYQLDILSANAEQGMELLLDVVQRPRLEDEEIEKEKTLLLGRLQAASEDNLQMPIELARQSAYGDHPYGRPRLGFEKSVRGLTPDGVRNWHERLTRLVLPTLVFYGDFGGTALSQPLIRRFAGDQFQARKAQTPFPLPQLAVTEQTRQRDSRQSALALAFRVRIEDDGDLEALDVYQKINSGLGGRFFLELRDRQSLAYTVALLVERRVHGATLLAYIATSPENEQKARAGLLDEFRKFLTEPLRDEELFQSRMAAIGSYQIGLQDRGRYLNEVMANVLDGRGVEAMEKYAEIVRGLKESNIKSLAQRFSGGTLYGVGLVRGTARAGQ